jgi:hypothetical protein
MNKLKSVLLAYAESNLASLGGGTPKTSTVDLEKLAPQLQQVVQRNDKLFMMCVSMIFILFAANLTVVIIHHDNLKLVAGTSGIFGISAAGLIILMIKLWREKVATELVLGLLPALEPAVFKTVITTLIRRLS